MKINVINGHPKNRNADFLLYIVGTIDMQLDEKAKGYVKWKVSIIKGNREGQLHSFCVTILHLGGDRAIFQNILDLVFIAYRSSRSIQANVSVGMVKNGNFPTLSIIRKIGLKILGFLDQVYISMSFSKFLQVFEKWQKMPDFWPKNLHLARQSCSFLYTHHSKIQCICASRYIYYTFQ